MKLETLLRTLVLGEILLAIATGVVDLISPVLLPSALREFNDAQLSEEFTTLDWIAVAIAPFAIASVFGVWLLKNWGRWLYTVTSGGYFVLEFFSTQQVMSSPASVLNDLSFACLGGALVLMWFSELKHRFRPGPAGAGSTPP